MATLQDIKRRIRSVRNTRKITKAMELVAGARLRRAEARIVQLRDYADRMQELTAGTARAAASLRGLTLLQQREPRNVAIVALTGDRGLAGAFNAQILRRAFGLERTLRSEGQEVRWLVVGRKGRSTLEFRRYELDQAWAGFTDRPSYSDAQAIAHRLEELYKAEEIDRAVVVYNQYVSPLVQRVTEQQVLPISEE
jgi:F-type H+-transporting ATPase subunit gamma